MPESVSRDEMLAMSVITTLCAAGVAFYLRFLYALWKEMKPGLIEFSRRFRPRLGRNVAPGLTRSNRTRPREALRLIEVKRNTAFEELRKDVS
jgi:hypothetical protein